MNTPNVQSAHPGEYIGATNPYYNNQAGSQYPYAHQSYYIQPQPALTATTGSQITYQLQVFYVEYSLILI